MGIRGIRRISKYNFKKETIIVILAASVILVGGNLFEQSLEHSLPEILYASDGGRQLLTIDTATGKALTKVSMSPVPQGRGFVGLAFDPKQPEKLFAGQGSGSSDIYNINTVTGLATRVGNAGSGSTAVKGMDAGPSCDLYAVLDKITGNSNNQLAKIDRTSGAATGIVPLVPLTKGMDSIAFRSDGKLFGVSNNIVSKVMQTKLYTINPDTGEMEEIAQVKVPATNKSPSGGILAIDFDINNILYAGTGKAVSPAKDGGLVGTINLDQLNGPIGTFAPVGTVAATTGSPLEAFAFFIGDNFPPKITLNTPPGNPVRIKVGTDYLDAGATLTDCHEGGSVPLTGTDTVNTSVSDVYTVTYSSGAITATRTVNVNEVKFTDDDQKYQIGEEAIVHVEDFLATATTVQASVSSIKPDNTIRHSVPVTLSGLGVYDGPVLLVTSVDPDPNITVPQLVVAVEDRIQISYEGLSSDSALIIPEGALGFVGNPQSTSNVVLWIESDVYTMSQAANLRVNDGSADTNFDTIQTVQVTVTSKDSSGATLGTLTMTLNENGVHTGIFTTPAAITFSTTTVASSNIIRAAIDGTVTATYPPSGTNNAIATIVAAINSASTDPSFTPDGSVRPTCVSDIDSDSICDNWEDYLTDHPTQPGILIPASVAGHAYYLACNPNAVYSGATAGQVTDPSGATVCAKKDRKDIFVELDWFAGHKFSTVARNANINAFAAAPVRGVTGGPINGIALHIIEDQRLTHVNEIALSSTNPADITLASLKEQNYGTSTDRLCPGLTPGTTACNDFIRDTIEARRTLVHYGLIAHKVQGDPFSSGYGEKPGDTFMLTLGSLPGGVGSDDQQGGTFMHELAHNLGRDHGGNDNINCKPNYLSRLNYLFQFRGQDGGFVNDFPMDLNRVAYSAINENALREDINSMTGSPAKATKIGGKLGTNTIPPYDANTGSRIDWNRDGLSTSTTSYAQNVHFFDILGCQDANIRTLPTAQNDWLNLVYNMRQGSNYDKGFITINQDHEIEPPPGIPSSETIDPDVIVTGATINEGALYETNVAITDPHHSSWTVVINFGDGSPPVTNTVSASQEIDDHTYADDGTYTVTVTVTNNLGGSSTATALVTVNNLPPNITSVNNNGPVDEGGPATVTVLATDVPADPLAYSFDCDNDGTYEIGPQVGNSAQCATVDNPSLVVGVRVTDDFNPPAEATGSTSVTINNVSPTGTLESSANPAIYGQIVTFTTTYTDPGTLDTQTVVWNWGDGTPDSSSTMSAGGSGSTETTHEYKQAGDFTVTQTITDKDGGIATKTLDLHINYKDIIIKSPLPGTKVELGRSLPLKVTVLDENMLSVSNAIVTLYIDTITGDDGIIIPFVFSEDGYHLNFDTATLTKGPHTLIFVTDDGFTKDEVPILVK